MILLDTSGLLAAIDEDQPHHAVALRSVKASDPRLLSPFVLAELDYLLIARVGQAAELALLREVARGAYRVEWFLDSDIREAVTVIDRYADLGLGLADASIVVLAQRYHCNRILTLDERHFRAIRGPDGRPFELLPSDAVEGPS